MRIYLHELKTSLKSLFIWTGSLALLIFIAVAKYSAFAGNPESLAILDSMPPAMLDALNMRVFNLTSLTGFYGVMFTYFALIGGMAAAMWGSEVISKEERDRTVEFSLVLPVSRKKVVTAKLLAALTDCILFVLFTWIISIIAVRSYQPDQEFYDFLRLEMLAMYLIELIFLSVGVLMGCAMKKYKHAGSTAIGLILVAYFLFVLSRMHAKLDFFRFLTPFRYYDPADFIKTGNFESVYLLLTTVIVFVSLLSAYWIYDKRDLYI